MSLRLLPTLLRPVRAAVLLLASTVLASSCITEDVPADTRQGNFDALWRTLDERYCFFSYKAAEYGLDPYLVAAVIYVESGWQTEAESPKGALGLMQLMPATAEWIAGRLGEEYDPAAICEPEVNIRYGCWYLRFLFDRFPVTATALAAYNAGHNRVAAWLSSEEYSPDGSVLTSIPYPETEQYVGKVQRAYEKYKELYPNAFEEE